MDNDYFFESVPDGIANAIMDMLPDILCSGQEGYEFLLEAFGREVNGQSIKAFTDEHCSLLADAVNDYFELDTRISKSDGRLIIEAALRQWGG